LHFDEFSVLNLSKDAALLHPSSKAGLGAAERVNRDSIKTVFSLVSRKIWDFVEKSFLFLLTGNRVGSLKHIVISMG